MERNLKIMKSKFVRNNLFEKNSKTPSPPSPSLFPLNGAKFACSLPQCWARSGRLLAASFPSPHPCQCRPPFHFRCIARTKRGGDSSNGNNDGTNNDASNSSSRIGRIDSPGCRHGHSHGAKYVASNAANSGLIKLGGTSAYAAPTSRARRRNGNNTTTTTAAASPEAAAAAGWRRGALLLGECFWPEMANKQLLYDKSGANSSIFY